MPSASSAAKSVVEKSSAQPVVAVGPAGTLPRGVARASSTGKKSGRGKPPAPVAPVVPRPPVRSQFDHMLVGSMPAAKIPGQKASASTAPPRLVKGRPVDTTPPQAPRPVPVPVTSGEKAKKNQAGLNSRDLEHYRDLLLAKRRELVGDMSSMEHEALRSTSGSNLSNLPVHMADMGTDNYEQEFTLGLMEKDRGLLREINAALAKIQDGTFGLCEGTNLPIRPTPARSATVGEVFD